VLSDSKPDSESTDDSEFVAEAAMTGYESVRRSPPAGSGRAGSSCRLTQLDTPGRLGGGPGDRRGAASCCRLLTAGQDGARLSSNFKLEHWQSTEKSSESSCQINSAARSEWQSVSGNMKRPQCVGAAYWYGEICRVSATVTVRATNSL
jgi:hypothetical protein